MARPEENVKFPSCDAYFDTIQSKKKLPLSLQESLTAAFAQIPVSSFPDVPSGRVIEIPGDTSILDAVRILSEHNIRSAPVLNPESGAPADWQRRYLGIIDYSAIILWVLENAELAAVALSAGSATAAGVGIGAVGAVGVAALSATGPAAVAGLTAAAVGAAVAGGLTAEKGMAKDGLTAADHLGEDFYKVLLQQEPFKSTTVRSIVESYHWSPFVPVTLDSPMLTVLLLLSKYRLRNVPVVEPDKPVIKNFITQTAVVKGLQRCKGRDWFDYISALPLSELGLPFMSFDEVITVNSDDLILEAFKCMKDNKIGGMPVVEGPKRKLVGSVSIRDIRFLLLRPDLFSNFRQLTVLEFMKTLGSEICYFKNGACQGTAFVDIPGGRYYPAASLYTLPDEPNCEVRFNFGPDFEFFPEDFGGRPAPKAMSEVPYQAYELKNEGPTENGIAEKAAQRHLQKQPKTLIVVEAYSIGKEDVYLAISQALEVGCTSGRVEHEASTSKIGEDQLFYFQQRGIDHEKAVAMMIGGFCKAVFDHLPLEFAQE